MLKIRMKPHLSLIFKTGRNIRHVKDEYFLISDPFDFKVYDCLYSLFRIPTTSPYQSNGNFHFIILYANLPFRNITHYFPSYYLLN